MLLNNILEWLKNIILFIGLILLILLSVSCVSANQDDTVLANDNDNILALDEDDIQVQANEGENEVLSADEKNRLNEQMSDELEQLSLLKQQIVDEISPENMYSSLKEEKFSINLSEEL